jgi:mRNA interferase MazF
MQEGDIALAAIPQADAQQKIRPVVLLRRMPGRGDFLVAGISTQLQEQISGFDQPLFVGDHDFAQTGLTQSSVVRLGFLGLVPRTRIAGTIGSLTPERHHQLLRRLSSYLVAEI